jgi:hypothetical protein
VPIVASDHRYLSSRLAGAVVVLKTTTGPVQMAGAVAEDHKQHLAVPVLLVKAQTATDHGATAVEQQIATEQARLFR